MGEERAGVDEGGDEGGDDARRVELRRVVVDAPAELLIETDEFQREVIREYDLIALDAERAERESRIPVPEVAAVRALLNAYGSTYERLRAEAEAAVTRGEETVTVTIELPPQAAEAAELYLESMERVDEHCRARRLLAVPSDQVSAFRRHFTEDVIRQLRG